MTGWRKSLNLTTLKKKTLRYNQADEKLKKGKKNYRLYKQNDDEKTKEIKDYVIQSGK